MHCEFCLIKNGYYFTTPNWVEKQSEGYRFPNTAARKFFNSSISFFWCKLSLETQTTDYNVLSVQ